MMSFMAVDLRDYELSWPTDLFVSEAERIDRLRAHSWTTRAEWLLTEAFASRSAAIDFEDLASKASEGGWGTADPWCDSQRELVDHQREWFKELIHRAPELRHATAPRPYWPQRQAAASVAPGVNHDARGQFVLTIREFEKNGYLAERFGEDCVDDPQDLEELSIELERRLGIAGLWPLSPSEWDDDTFYGLIEVFHDLVSRPRNRSYHSYGQCGWHHSEFHVSPGRALYTWRMNRMLREAGIQYEIAAEGEDRGRLVAVTDDARADLVHRALHVPEPDVQERIKHAVALFRNRSASRESKRSAIVALAGLLEERRQLIRDDVGKQDEGALFEIANRFEIRHRRAEQRGNYDAAFLDWIFWWYLATVELTNSVIASRSV